MKERGHDAFGDLEATGAFLSRHRLVSNNPAPVNSSSETETLTGDQSLPEPRVAGPVQSLITQPIEGRCETEEERSAERRRISAKASTRKSRDASRRRSVPSGASAMNSRSRSQASPQPVAPPATPRTALSVSDCRDQPGAPKLPARRGDANSRRLAAERASSMFVTLAQARSEMRRSAAAAPSNIHSPQPVLRRLAVG